MNELDALYVQQNPYVTITPSFGASGTLQTQIQQGADVDIFFSAGTSQMNALQNGSLIVNASRKNLLKNTVVLIVPNGSTLGLTNFTDLTGASVSKVAIGDPGSVPAGQYAQLAFDQLNITSQIQSKLILCINVRQVLTYVESDEVDAGVVYATDALTSSKVRVVAQAPAAVNAKIVYPVAIINGTKILEAATKYEAFLSSNQSKAIFEKYGFTVVNN
jgi:molybdate transport system substrate-binding protein